MGEAAQAVTVSRDGDIGLIEIDHPPVNSMNHAVRAGLLEAVEALDADGSVRAIVVHGRGKHFIAGADLSEMDAGPRPPLLHDVLARLEAAAKPVIAALHGTTLGGGAELALASHYRCATRDLSLGFPEVKVGLIPGSGGTVRLPRLAGVKATLDLMVGAQPIGFDAALAAGLVDREISGDVRAAAIAYARELVAGGAPLRRTRDLPVAGPLDAGFFATYRAGLTVAQRKVKAVARVVEAVEAATTGSFDAGLARARELFVESRESVESRALRHLFFAERGASSAARSRTVTSIGVVGAGTMGSGIAISALTAGFDVVLVDLKPEAVGAGRQRITTTFEEQVRKGRLTEGAAAAALGRLTTRDALEALDQVDLVIEAVFENLEVKQSVFGELGRLCRPGAVLATNTSTLDVDAIAAASGRAADVVGMHFFSPANIMRLVEIVRGAASAEDALSTVISVTRRLGKIGVVVGNCYGFVGNRMLYAYGREKELMLLEGAPPERIDRALEAFGMAMGPNAVGDLAGLDIGFHARRGWKDKPKDPRFYRVSDALAEQGRYGQKTGRGFYRYEAGARRGTPDPEVTELIRAEAGRLGVRQREIGDEEIVGRCILALVNEGARILGEGIAASAADIDVVWCNGYGFPRDRGGPMFYADTLGMTEVLSQIRTYARDADARYWEPAPLIIELAARGAAFGSPEGGRS